MNVEQITRDIRELESVRSQTRSWRTAAALGVIVIIVACVMNIVNSVKNLALPGPTREEFFGYFQKGFSDDVMPQVKMAAGSATQQLTPVIQTELQKLNRDVPRVTAAAEKELKVMQESLPKRAENIVETTVGDMLRRREKQIRQMYPNLTDDKVSLLMNNLTEEGRNRVVKILDDLFQPQQNTLDQILAHLDQIQEVERPNIKDETPTWDMAILFFDVIKEDLKGLNAEDFPAPGTDSTTGAP